MSTTWKDINGEILINAQIYGKAGKGDEIAKWIVKLQEDVKANEPDTLEYTFGRRGDTFVTWERFSNAEALKLHLANKIMKQFAEAELVDKPHTALFYGSIHENDA